MTLSMAQRRVLEEWMRSKGIVQCPACTEGAGVVKVSCGYVALFDAETLGIRGVWAQDRNP